MGVYGLHDVSLDTHPDFCHFSAIIGDSSIFRTSHKELN